MRISLWKRYFLPTRSKFAGFGFGVLKNELKGHCDFLAYLGFLGGWVSLLLVAQLAKSEVWKHPLPGTLKRTGVVLPLVGTRRGRGLTLIFPNRAFLMPVINILLGDTIWPRENQVPGCFWSFTVTRLAELLHKQCQLHQQQSDALTVLYGSIQVGIERKLILLLCVWLLNAQVLFTHPFDQ